MSADWTSALARARENAPFLARALDRRPDLAELLAAGEGEQALLAAKQVEAADIPTALRRDRLGLALVLAVTVQNMRPESLAYPGAVIWALAGVIVANLDPVNAGVIGLAALGIVLLAVMMMRRARA